MTPSFFSNTPGQLEHRRTSGGVRRGARRGVGPGPRRRRRRQSLRVRRLPWALASDDDSAVTAVRLALTGVGEAPPGGLHSMRRKYSVETGQPTPPPRERVGQGVSEGVDSS